ncbi:glycoside hydrolase family 13 protein [Arachidicoccus sp.]|uniref:glycoside hydrolase family 13 protein n=1 Tax=Arachidicoccus sp. TaxID=1872624 RepID=UPI003D1DDD88
MKRFFTVLFGLFILNFSFAQMPALERVVPMFWWTNMVNPHLQLLVHGNKIADCKVQLKYKGVTLQKVNKVENPNYLFLDLWIDKNTKPGSFDIVFSAKGKKDLHYTYQLKQQDKSPNRIQGVTDKDLIYLIMPDRFSNGDTTNDRVAGMKDQTLNRDSMYYRHGGDLQGIINHLSYLKDLGVTAIWCTPMIENDMTHASYHGYAATDLYKIDPRFGTNKLYKTYVEKCHAMGLKVIKDVVHNHIGSEGWIMKDLPMKSWIHQWPNYTNTNYRDQPLMDIHASASDRKSQLDGWFVPSMPDVNQNNPYVQNYYIQNHIWWIEYAGIDGLRLDTYPYNDPAFMAKWAIALKAQFPHLSIFGETFVQTVAEQAFYAGGNRVNRGFDTHLPGVTDYALKSAIYEALNGKFSWDGGVSRLYETLSQDFLYKDPTCNSIFLDDHDVSRFYSVIGENFDKYKEGIGILLTMRGIPEIYYGTEIFMKNFDAPDGLVREDFKGGWAEDSANKFTAQGRTAKENDAFNYVKTLANFRKNSTTLQTGKLMQYVPEDGVYVYFRYDDKQTIMIIVNSNDTLKKLNTRRFSERMNGFTGAENVVTKEKISNIASLAFAAQSTTILKLNK